MGYAFTLDEIGFLSGPAGATALARVQQFELSARTLASDVQRLRREYDSRTAALIETVLLRRRVAGKLDGNRPWLLTEDALQQATPEAVARHRALRLAGRAVHDVTCSTGTELVALTQQCPVVVGSDLDPIRLAMAAHNVPEAVLLRADAVTPVTRGTVVIADPARRADGRRVHDPERLQPPLSALLTAYQDRDIAVKCAPGLDFDRLDWTGEVELVSLDGGVKEVCLWSVGLAQDGVRRRATVLSRKGCAVSSDLQAVGGVSYSVTDRDPDELPTREPGEWIVNPDGAVVRAGLVRHYGARNGLWQLDPRIAYLTGNRVPAGIRGFRILERMEFREKPLRAELARRGVGSLEILVRGVDVDPDAFRAKLKLRGTQPAALVVTRIGSKATVFICAPGEFPE